MHWEKTCLASQQVQVSIATHNVGTHVAKQTGGHFAARLHQSSAQIVRRQT